MLLESQCSGLRVLVQGNPSTFWNVPALAVVFSELLIGMPRDWALASVLGAIISWLSFLCPALKEGL